MIRTIYTILRIVYRMKVYGTHTGLQVSFVHHLSFGPIFVWACKTQYIWYIMTIEMNERIMFQILIPVNLGISSYTILSSLM